MKLISDAMRAKSLILDPGKLSFDYVPEELPHREDEAFKLVGMLRPILEAPVSVNALITGPVGTGKTALSKRFCEDFITLAKQSSQSFRSCYVNCRMNHTSNSVLYKIIHTFQPEFPERGFTFSEMLRVLRRDLHKSESRLIVVLDEVDEVVKHSGPDILYSLIRFDEDDLEPRGSISIIMISQKYVLDNLDVSVLSTLKRSNILEFSRYSANQLNDILSQRVDLAFRPGAIRSTVIELIADIAAVQGDARYAIEILEKAGRFADAQIEPEVSPEHVRAVKAEIYPTYTEFKLRQLERQELLTLLAVARALKRDAYCVTGDVKAVYELTCEEFGDEPRAHTMFWHYLNTLASRSYIDKKPSGEGQRGNTMMFSLSDITAEALEEKLEWLLTRRRR